MNQAQLERAVCRATGESREVVRRLGFQLTNVLRYRPVPAPHRKRWSPRPSLVRS